MVNDIATIFSQLEEQLAGVTWPPEVQPALRQGRAQLEAGDLLGLRDTIDHLEPKLAASDQPGTPACIDLLNRLSPSGAVA